MGNNDRQGFDFDDPDGKPHRLLMAGPCDDSVIEIAKYCGWHDELMDRFNTAKAKNEVAQLTDQVMKFRMDSEGISYWGAEKNE